MLWEEAGWMLVDGGGLLELRKTDNKPSADRCLFLFVVFVVGIH